MRYLLLSDSKVNNLLQVLQSVMHTRETKDQIFVLARYHSLVFDFKETEKKRKKKTKGEKEEKGKKDEEEKK